MSNVATREVICSGCSTLLRFPAGAQVVRCVLCSQITPAEPTRQPSHQAEQRQTTSHLICGGCRTVLAYPTGASSVRCAVCTTINQLSSQNTMASCRCEGCNTHLMYQPGASSVRCALCQYVTQVGGAVPQAQQQPRQQQPSTSGAAGTSGVGGGQAAEAGGQGAFVRQNSNTLYVIQNPSPEGEERYNMAIGVKVLDATGVDAGGSKEDGQQQKT